MTTKQILENAVKEKPNIAVLLPQAKNAALSFIADSLESSMCDILAANESDLAAAKGTMSDVMLDRLRLDEGRIRTMAQGVRAVAALPDPVGEIMDKFTRPDGLEIGRAHV